MSQLLTRAKRCAPLLVGGAIGYGASAFAGMAWSARFDDFGHLALSAYQLTVTPIATGLGAWGLAWTTKERPSFLLSLAGGAGGAVVTLAFEVLLEFFTSPFGSARSGLSLRESTMAALLAGLPLQVAGVIALGCSPRPKQERTRETGA